MEAHVSDVEVLAVGRGKNKASIRPTIDEPTMSTKSVSTKPGIAHAAIEGDEMPTQYSFANPNLSTSFEWVREHRCFLENHGDPHVPQAKAIMI